MPNQKIYRNFDTRETVDSNGSLSGLLLEIAYPQQPVWELHYMDNANTPVDLSGLTFRAAIDDDFDDTSEVMSRSTPEMIDISEADDGIIKVQNDADNSPFHIAVNALADGQKRVYFQLYGYNTLGKEVFFDRFDVLAVMPIDPQGATLPPPEPDTQWASKTWVYSLVFLPPISANLAALGETTVYTVPTGKLFIPEEGYIMVNSISGSGVLPKIKWKADAVDLMGSRRLDADTQYKYDKDVLGADSFYPAGTLIKLEVTEASTYTTHTAKAIIKGVLIDA